MKKVIIGVIAALFISSPVHAFSGWKDIAKADSNFKYTGNEPSRSVYKYAYNSFGVINQIHLYGKVRASMRHFDYGALVRWADYDDKLNSVKALNRKQDRLKISNRGPEEFVRIRYFDAVNYVTFDGEWVKENRKAKCFGFDTVYNDDIDRVAGLFCRDGEEG